MDNVEKNRRMLQSITAGGNGEVEGVIYEMPEPDAYGNHYYFINDGITTLVHTKEEAERLLHFGQLDI